MEKSSSPTSDHCWEALDATDLVLLRRSGRFLVAELREPHRVLSTSVKNGGQADHIRYLVNHQSCEGAGHTERSEMIHDRGQRAYHDLVCDEIGIEPGTAVVMGTAANMNYAALAIESDNDVRVTAVVTAGVQTNAVCAGDPASWRETQGGNVKLPVIGGTINTLLLINRPVDLGALARVVVNMTEGKSAALQRLAVPSCYSEDLATGTGTDQFCIAAPLEGTWSLTSASPHMKFGELIGLSVRKATQEALRWQNGLEASYTRGLFHALGRYGLKEATVFDDLRDRLDPNDLELLRKNSKAAFYEPLVGAAGHSLAAVFDRVRHGMLPDSVIPDAVVQPAAALAASLAAQPHRWAEFRAALHASGEFAAKPLTLGAIALGWRAKWRSN